MPCGIMDQYISVHGRAHSAVEIDCRSLGHRLVDLPDGVTFVAVNTMVKHELAGSAYRDRVAECAAAARALGVESLRDASPEQLAAAAARMPEVVLRRARHVVTEDARVHAFVEASARGDVAEMGRLMVESHRSLQHDYEVSCAELDFLVDRALEIEGVLGSRMTGGGFGGCTVNLVERTAVDAVSDALKREFEKRYGRRPEIFTSRASQGAIEH